MGVSRDTKQNIGTRDSDKYLNLKRANEKVQLEEGPTVIEKQNINDSFILGSSTNGVLGTSKLGSDLSERIKVKVINPDDVFKEHYVDSYFIDNTNSTVSPSSGSVSFSNGDKLKSKIIYKNNDISISRVKITAEGNLSDLLFYVSVDEGTTWEQVNIGEFTDLSTSTNTLMYKIEIESSEENSFPLTFPFTFVSFSGEIEDLSIRYE